MWLYALLPALCAAGNETAMGALQDIAYYLRAHKFNEWDRRYEAKPARGDYYAGFPRPPLRALHWEVHKFCAESFIDCVNYLRKRVQTAGMKRSDDTAVVIKDQKWNREDNAAQIDAVDAECRKLRDADNILANPFQGPLERFQWRTTASYYMCWYTLKSEPALEHLGDACDNLANCLDESRPDPRAEMSLPFSCSLYSFCPDPCCPFKHLTRQEKCWNSPDNPCFQANPPGQRECGLNRSLNTDFSDLILNRWNVSCGCPDKGFEWSSFYGLCIDRDECVAGGHNCEEGTQKCLNLPGSFACVCKWGHSYNATLKHCVQDPALAQVRTWSHRESRTTSWSQNLLQILGFLGKSQGARLEPHSLALSLCLLCETLLIQ